MTACDTRRPGQEHGSVQQSKLLAAGTFPGGPVAKTQCSYAEALSSIPGQGKMGPEDWVLKGTKLVTNT